MSRLTASILMSLLFSPLSHAQEEKEVSPRAQYEALSEEFKKARFQLSKAGRATKSREEQNKISRKMSRLGVEYAPRFMKLAKDHPTDPASFDALSWIVTAASRFGGKEAAEALDLLAKNHIEDKRLGVVCERLRNSNLRETAGFLETVLDNSPHRDVQGLACYSLATQLKRTASRNPGNRERIEKLRERIIAEFSDIQTRGRALGPMVKAEIFEENNLSIGKVAPDITGDDLDGVDFKLSDYRGKVVVLGFWGNW